jgi:putative two-component system response regulator
MTLADATLRTAKVLVVDDEEPLRRGLVRMLTGAGYSCASAASAAEGRAVLAQQHVDMVLCDVNMPGENGFGLLRTISEEHPEVAVIMVTALADVRAAEPAARYGALGYVLKPFESSEILINVATALTRRARDLRSAAATRALSARVDERTAALEDAVRMLSLSQQTIHALHEETVLRLATVAEWRDPCTGTHLRSMSELSGALARAAGLDQQQVDMVRVASLLHDLGKVAVPDSILLKAGPLTVEERVLMQEHSQTGAAMLRGSSVEVLQTGALIALTHHERWDGSGYPRGLAGTEIPIEARIVSIADVYDALSSVRPYKAAWARDRVVATLLAGRGTQFDPELLDAFLAEVVQ